MLAETEVIVLRSMKYRDTSKIVTFYSKKYGKVKGIAKGARTAKNKFGSSLEPMSHSMLIFYKKENRDLHLISKCDAINSFQNLCNDLERMSSALAALELTDHVTHQEEQNKPLFMLLHQMMALLNSAEGGYNKYLDAFSLKLAAIFGYMPNFNSCGGCGKPVSQTSDGRFITFNISRGSVFCRACYDLNENRINRDIVNNPYIPFTISGLDTARKLLEINLDRLDDVKYDANVGNEINEIIRLYIRYHFDGLKTLKSIEYLQKQCK